MKIKAFNMGMGNPLIAAMIGLHEATQLGQTYENISHDRAQAQGQDFTNAALAQGAPVTSMPGGFGRHILSTLTGGMVAPDVQASPAEMNQETLALRGQDEQKLQGLNTLAGLRQKGGPGMFGNVMANSPLGRAIAGSGISAADWQQPTPTELKEQQAIAHQQGVEDETKRYHDATLQNNRARMIMDAGRWRVDESLRRANLDISAHRESRESEQQRQMDELLNGVADDPSLSDNLDKALPGTHGMNTAATAAASKKTIANLKWARTGDPAVDNIRRALAGNSGFKEWLQHHPEALLTKQSLTSGIKTYQKEAEDFRKSQVDIDASLSQIDKLQKYMDDNRISGDTWSDTVAGRYRQEAQRMGLPQSSEQRTLANLISQLNSTATRSYVTGTRFGSKYLDRITAHLPKEGGTPDSVRNDITDLKSFLLQLKAARTPISFETAVTGAPNSTSAVDAFKAE